MVRAEDWDLAIEWAKQKYKQIALLAGPSITEKYKVDDYYVFDDDSVEAATHGLYSGLRSLDEAESDVILAQVFIENELGAAYMNRLKKAAAQKYFEKN